VSRPQAVIVANGVTVTFSNAFAAQNSGLYWEAGSNSVVNILGDVGGNQSVYSSTNGGIYVLANNVGNGVTWIDATVIQTNGTFSPGASFFVGRPNGSSLQPNNGAGTYVLATPTATFTDNGGTTIVARGGGQGTFIISNGATANVGTGANDNMVLDNDSSGGEGFAGADEAQDVRTDEAADHGSAPVEGDVVGGGALGEVHNVG